MSLKLKMLAGVAAAAASTLAATPAAAQFGGYYPDPYYDRGGFDIQQGIAVVGTIANILNIVRGGGYGYNNGYGYGAPYGRSNYYGGYSYDYAYAVNNAVNSCGREAQRRAYGGRVEVRDVDRVSGNRLRVRGVYDDLRGSRYGRIDRDGFSCVTYGNGQIQSFRG